MSQKLENAKNLYLEGIRDGNIDVVDKYTGDRYTQHSTGVKDGAEGFKAFFADFLQRTTDRDIRIIRALEDGNYVFVQAFQDIDNGSAQWITTDLFDTDADDKIVEHWDVIAPYVPPSETLSGNDPIFGDFELKDLDKTEENKALVRLFFTDVLQNKNVDALYHYLSAESYTQHSPTMPNGSQAVKDFLSTADDFRYDFVFHVMGQGDHVVAYSQVHYNGEKHAAFDIFRIENGKIVEHWDNAEPIPPRHEWANTGKF